MKSVLSLVILFAASPVVADEVSFSRDIQSIFSEKCYDCHGPDKSEAGLRLDLEKNAFAELDSGDRAIVPGKPNGGTLLERISSSDDSERMPPEGDSLTAEQIQTIKKWIESGAKFDKHWSYVPVKKTELPKVKKPDWIRNEIDLFVLAKLESLGIEPSKEAFRSTLIKRVYYDLVGLPPDPKVVDEFVEAKDPKAYEKIVDQLLDSKHFGERWGRHWLDKARYADSDGYEKDRPRPNAWRYRDWVIDAINDDMPYDQFTIEQLAGDLIPNAGSTQKLATAFHRQTLTNTEGGTDQEQFRIEATFDRTETVGAIWMGLTMTCARCHTHKYDQITQTEYYQLFSFFNDANESNTSVPTSTEALKKHEVELAAHNEKLDKLRKEFDAAKKSLQPELKQWLVSQRQLLKKLEPPRFHGIHSYQTKTTSGAKISVQDDGAMLVSGPVPDKDKYTIFVDQLVSPVTGIQIEVLTDKSLPAKGPGRAKNGNFVLSQIRAYISADKDFKKFERLEFASADSDFSQNKFSAEGALSDVAKSGWAVAPQMGKPHKITFYLKRPIDFSERKFLQVVLDQPYGGQHTIGKFRIKTMTGNDVSKTLPKAVVTAIQSEKPTEKQSELLLGFFAKGHKKTATLWKSFNSLKSKPPAPPMMNVRVISPATRTTKLLYRGDFLQPQNEVRSDVLGVVSASHPLLRNQNETTKPNRMELAQWLVDKNHPLTARVTVNHVWAHLFGKGIVGTQNDFGVRGDMPTHPGLLDWLAWQLPRDMNWSRKALIKKIVMSATYRQSSVHRPDTKEIDPTNKWLSRQNRVRVSAEIVRDVYLAASGLLTRKVGGPSVFPPLPSGVANLSYANNFKWKTSQGDDRYRRGMYTFFKRTSPHPNLISFDCPDSNTTKIDRDKSNTPIQALITLNNEVYIEAAQAMAKRILKSDKKTDFQKLEYAIRLCIARKPSHTEVLRFEKLLKLNSEFYEKNPELAKKLVTRHEVMSMPVTQNAAWVATTRMIMNLDEFIVRE